MLLPLSKRKGEVMVLWSTFLAKRVLEWLAGVIIPETGWGVALTIICKHRSHLYNKVVSGSLGVSPMRLWEKSKWALAGMSPSLESHCSSF